jgi:peroxiredoxin
MQRHCRRWWFAVVVVLAGALARGGPARSGAKQPPADEAVPNVRLQAPGGKEFSLHDLKGKKAVVVVFLSFDCPVSTSYSATLADLSRAFKDKGVAFLGVTPGTDETPDAVADHARDYKIPFPVLNDPRCAAADALGARVTPEAVVLDGQWSVRYRGRIDNGYTARLKKNRRTTSHDLRRALDELLAGKPVSRPATEAVGCKILRPAAAAKAPAKVTFYRDVQPILQERCQACHRPGEVGPFALMNYRQAVQWAEDIKEFTQSRRMPPWKPTEGVPFHNERKLTAKEIDTLAAWYDADTPEGDPKDAPPPRKFPAGWQLGKPDLVLTPSAGLQIGPRGTDLFRCFVLPTDLPGDRYVSAVEVRPSNPRVVHHVLLYVDPEHHGRALEQKEEDRKKDPAEADGGPGYTSKMGIGFRPSSGLGGWAPGNLPRFLPDGTGYPLPKGADVIMQVHYHRDGKAEKDRTAIGLYFAKKPVTTRYGNLTLIGLQKGRWGIRFTVPAGADNFRLTGSMWVDQDCTLHSVMPHMHLIGKKVKVTATAPDSKPLTLVSVGEWDYNWQETYVLKKPLAIKAGTRFDVEAYYDNTAQNPNNPFDPPRDISYGEQTTDEMCFVFLGVTTADKRKLKPRYYPKPEELKKLRERR